MSSADPLIQSPPAAHTSQRTPVTAQNALFTFYDVESLSNVFTVAFFHERMNMVELFYLLEPGSELEQKVTGMDIEALRRHVLTKVIAENPAFRSTKDDSDNRVVRVHNLATAQANEYFARIMGLFEGRDVNNRNVSDAHGGRFRPICDTDPAYDPINHDPYLMGYNSNSYDTTILAAYFHEVFQKTRENQDVKEFIPTTPAVMRKHNDAMFSEPYKGFMPRYLTHGPISLGDNGYSLGWDAPASIIRRNFLDSGRHLDVARFNEVQNRIGLKRLLGMLGYQILESDKLGSHNATVDTFDEFLELLAYNASDVIGLAKVFQEPIYSNGFDLKKSLLDEYPETIYDCIPGTHKPDINPTKVRYGRLTPDATSARFVGLILAPYKNLEDIPAVSFMYPSKQVAAETNQERRNVLDDCIAFLKENIDDSTPQGKQALEQFDVAMSYYKMIEGKNFNELVSDDFQTLSDIPKTANNVPYFNKDGSPSSCFVTFSVGGIHGAEYNVAAHEALSADADSFNALLAEVESQYPDPLDFWKAHPGKTTYVAQDGTEYTRSQILTAKTSLKLLTERHEALQQLEGCAPEDVELRLKDIEQEYEGIGYRPKKPRPEIFEVNTGETNKGSTSLRKQLRYTSAGLVTHEDFTSYYPNMLRNMSAFFNPDLGEDRYAKIFNDKQRYEHEMRKPGITPEERTRLKLLREGTKLILNSATGAGDVTTKSPIRMNNQIISMRIIGQLFTWRIGQAQTFAGARIVSTNTDGLYSILDPEINNKVLAEESKAINVDIVPEQLFLISKDSNSRLEMGLPQPGESILQAPFISASGGTLACHAGPNPTKALAHSAVLDWALARYLRRALNTQEINDRIPTLDQPLNPIIAKMLMEEARDQEDTLLAARLFQTIVSASTGKLTFPYVTDDESGNATPLQHYNRVFIVKDDTPGAVHIQVAGAYKITQATSNRRKADNSQSVVNETTALKILQSNGWSRDGKGNTQIVPGDHDIATRSVPRISPEWFVKVDNRDLAELSPKQIRTEILSQLDIDKYIELLARTYEENWMNKS